MRLGVDVDVGEPDKRAAEEIGAAGVVDPVFAALVELVEHDHVDRGDDEGPIANRLRAEIGIAAKIPGGPPAQVHRIDGKPRHVESATAAGPHPDGVRALDRRERETAGGDREALRRRKQPAEHPHPVEFVVFPEPAVAEVDRRERHNKGSFIERREILAQDFLIGMVLRKLRGRGGSGQQQRRQQE